MVGVPRASWPKGYGSLRNRVEPTSVWAGLFFVCSTCFDSPMFDLRADLPAAWSEELKPRGESTLQKEPFEAWWARNKFVLSNLHPEIAEQWIYRHWTYSPYCHLPLSELTWRVERWPTVRIIEELRLNRVAGEWNSEFDYKVFHGKEFEPGRTMDAVGTWNIPIIIIETPHGVLSRSGPHPDARYWLIEGHQRLRYLNALHERNSCAAEHAIFVLAPSSIWPRQRIGFLLMTFSFLRAGTRCS